jgi:hypothetical protein
MIIAFDVFRNVILFFIITQSQSQRYVTTGGSYVTSSLTREWVCRLQLMLALVSAVILRSGYRGTHNHISLPQIRGSSNLEGKVPYLYPPGTRWPSYTPRHWVPFSSSLTTRISWISLIIYNFKTPWAALSINRSERHSFVSLPYTVTKSRLFRLTWCYIFWI